MKPRVYLNRAMLGGALISVTAGIIQGGTSGDGLPRALGYWFGAVLGGAFFGAVFAHFANRR